MSLRINGVLVTGIAASTEPCGWCGCARFEHKNGRGACTRSVHPKAPRREAEDYTAPYRTCSRWTRKQPTIQGERAT